LKELLLNGLKVQVSRKRIKNINLRVSADRVSLSIPWYIDEERALMFLHSKQEWIRNRQQLLQKRNPVPVRFQDGQILWLWGKPFKLRLVQLSNGTKPSAILEGDCILFNLSHPDDAAQCEKMYKELLKNEMQNVLAARVAFWEHRMGAHADQIAIRDMKTRWGSCIPAKRRICINLRLVHYPLQCLDCTIVHEISHLFIPGHDRAFYAIMDRFMPEWRAADRILKENRYQ